MKRKGHSHAQTPDRTDGSLPQADGSGERGKADRIAEVLEKLRYRMEAGETTDRDSLATEYPEIADELMAGLEGLEFMFQAATQLAEDRKPDSPSLEPLACLGDFRITREIGRGGMGIVYEAQQLSVGRRVALKVLPFAAALDPKQLQRFKNEAIAAGALDHPNIVPVYSVSCDRGVHYHAMRLVEGQSLADSIAQLRESEHEKAGESRAAASSSRAPAGDTQPIAGLSTKRSTTSTQYFHTVARLGIQAASALQHAHEVGLIHRDIKPSNLLVDPQGNLWVTDFGLAQMPGESNLTLSGDLLGTVRYMSPEQAAGKRAALNHRTDIYSLGVTLYELLTLRPAYPDADPQVILRQIAEVEPLAPRRLNADISSDLETIILKAVSKEPGDRYATAQAMADDLRRFLENKPIVARRPALVSRAAKWARRNSVLLTAIATTLILSLALSTAALWKEQQNTANALTQSEANWELARQAVDDMYSRVAMEWLADQPHLTKLQQELLLKAAEFYERIPASNSQDADVLYESANAKFRAGRVFNALGESSRSQRLLTQSLDTYDQSRRHAPQDIEYAVATATAMHELGKALAAERRQEDARSILDRALELVAQVLADHPRNKSARIEQVTIHRSLTLLCPLPPLFQLAKSNDEVKERRGYLLEAVRLSAELVEDFPDDPRCQLTYVASMLELALSTVESPEKEELLRKALHTASTVAEQYPMNAAARNFLGGCQNHLAGVLLGRNQIDQSLQLLRESQAQFRTLMNNCPDVPAYRQNLVSQYNLLVETLIKEQRWEEAEAAGQEAVSLCTQLPAGLDKEHFQGDMARALERLARVQMELNKLESALDSYNKCLELDPSCVFAFTNRGRLHEKLGHKDAALADLKKVVELAPNEFVPYNQLGGFYWHQRQFEAASQVFAKIIELDPKGSMGYGNRGEALFHLGRYDEALADLTQGQERGPKDPYVNSAIAWLLVAGPPEMRDPQKAVAIAESGLVLDNEKTKILGGAWFRLGQYPQAKNALTSAVELTDESSLQQFGETLLFLAMACDKLGDHEEAYRWFTQAEAWIKENAGPEDVHLRTVREAAAALLASLAATLEVPEDDGPHDLDPRGNQVLVAQKPAAFAIRLYSAQELSPAARQWQGVTMTRDGRPLQAGLDYVVRYDPERQTLAFEPSAGVFEDGVYRISIPQTLEASETTRPDLVISVCSRLSNLRHLTLKNGRDGYVSAKYQSFEPVELVPRGAGWRYLDDGSDAGVAWQELDFDDAKWKTGRAQLGYGDGDETTAIEFGPDSNNKYATTYFRHRFQVTDSTRFPLLRVSLLRDDGAAVYLNGEEIVRDKLPAGASYNTYASATVGGESESVYYRYSVNSRVLLKGDNCLAVEVHQAKGDSTDISFDLRLTSPPLAIIAFEDLFGEGPRHIPAGATITSATLRFSASEGPPSDLRLTPAVINSNATDARAEFRANDIADGLAFDVQHTAQAWCDGEPNRGWFLTAADDSSSLDALQHSPELTVTFIAPGDLAPLAWHFANCADAKLRDPKLALEYAQRAVKSSPDDTNSRTALGAALYRNGQWDEAITALENVLERDRGNQRASIVLAMAYAECGRQESAREILAQLPEWREPRDLPELELSRLRGEADRLLSARPTRPRDTKTRSPGQ